MKGVAINLTSATRLSLLLNLKFVMSSKGTGHSIKLKLVLRMLNAYSTWFGVVVDDIKLIYDIIPTVGKELAVTWIKYKVGITWKWGKLAFFLSKYNKFHWYLFIKVKQTPLIKDQQAFRPTYTILTEPSLRHAWICDSYFWHCIRIWNGKVFP